MVETAIRLPKHVPTLTEVEAIAALSDPVQRNLKITLAYHDLNHALGVRLGCKNGNWCSYTTWASKTAGAFIRGERSSLSVQEYLEQADYVKQGLARLNEVLALLNQTISLKPAFLAAIIDQITDEVATHIGHGNRIVFAETAPVEATYQWLQDNLPPSVAGLIWLIWQTPLRRLARHIASDWRTIMTRWFMTIKLPAETLRLGQDVPHMETGMFPAELCEIQHPDLLALLQELDETPNSSLGSAASDWGCLRDRMNYLVDFFRSRQQDGRLYQQPFCDAQVAIIRAGGIPPRPL